MLRPPLAGELVAEFEALVVEGAPPKRFRTICSLMLGARLSVNSGELEPWFPTLRETCSPPLGELAMLMVICSGLELLLRPLRLRIISGPLWPPEPDTGWARVPPGPPPLPAWCTAEARSVA